MATGVVIVVCGGIPGQTHQRQRAAVTAPPGAAQALTVAGYRAVYIDAAGEGARPVSGSPSTLQLGRLIVERPDAVLTASGDRRDGRNLDMLMAVLVSIP